MNSRLKQHMMSSHHVYNISKDISSLILFILHLLKKIIIISAQPLLFIETFKLFSWSHNEHIYKCHLLLLVLKHFEQLLIVINGKSNISSGSNSFSLSEASGWQSVASTVMSLSKLMEGK